MKTALKGAFLGGLCAVVIVSGVAGSLYVRGRNTHSRLFVESLSERMAPILAYLSTSAAENLHDRDTLSVVALPALGEQIEGVSFVTVTGEAIPDDGYVDYVWASSDPSLLQKTGGQSVRLGEIRLVDGLTVLEGELRHEIDAEAAAAVGELSERESELLGSIRALAARDEEAGTGELSTLIAEAADTAKEIASRLSPLGNSAEAMPRLEPRRIEELYLFYRPIVYRVRGDDRYFRGMVRVGVSTQALRTRLAEENRALARRCTLTGGIGSAVGIILALSIAVLLGRRKHGAAATAAAAPAAAAPAAAADLSESAPE